MSRLNSILAIAVITGGLVLRAGAVGGRRSLATQSSLASSEVRCPGAAVDGGASDVDSNTRPSGCLNSTTDDEHTSPSIEQWQKRQREKNTRLFTVQMEILERLGLRRPPNVTSSNLTAQDLERFQEILRRSEDHDRTIYQRNFYAKRFQTVLPSCIHPRNSDSLWDEVSPTEMRLYFPMDPIAMTNRNRETRILVASLKLRRKKTDKRERLEALRSSNVSSEDAIIRITASIYTKPLKRGRREQKKVVKVLFINRNSGLTWTRIDIRTAVEDWMKRTNRNFGLQITVESDHSPIDPYEIFEPFDCSSRITGSSPVLTFPISEIESSETDEPAEVENGRNLPSIFLDVVTVDVPRRRPSRHSRDLQSYYQRSFCGMEKMFISFAELGWSDWIVQPKGFETGFCHGSCAKRTGSRTTNRKLSSDLTTLGLNECCGPVRARSLSVLQYNDKGKLTISVFDDFVVTECGCRR